MSDFIRAGKDKVFNTMKLNPIAVLIQTCDQKYQYRGISLF